MLEPRGRGVLDRLLSQAMTTEDTAKLIKWDPAIPTSYIPFSIERM